MLAALICVLAPISVPLPGGVPVSLATLAVMLTGCLLGPVWGLVSTLVYLLLGCVGLPVFAGYAAGLSRLAGPTGGYLVGYLPLASICGIRLFHQENRILKTLSTIPSMILGTAALYLLGTLWFCFVTDTGFLAALSLCVIPFLPLDLLKIAVTAVLVPLIESVLKRANLTDLRETAPMR